MEAACSTETLVSAYRISCYQNPGDHNLKIIPYKSFRYLNARLSHMVKTIILMGMEGILYGLYGLENSRDYCVKNTTDRAQ